MEAEARKGHSFMRTPLAVLAKEDANDLFSADTGCACFGGTESVADEIEAETT